MPFNPDEYLTKKQAAQPAAGTKDGFDPDAYLTSRGIKTAATTPAPQAPADSIDFSNPNTKAGAVAQAAAKGMSLGGLGTDLAPLISAAFPTATDEALGRGYTDRVLAYKAQMDQSAAEAQVAHPIISAATQITTSIPKVVATGAALKSLGLTNTIGQAGALGGLEGLTQSKKESIGQTAKDVTTNALLSAGLVALPIGASKFIKELPEAQLGSAADEFGNQIGKAESLANFNKQGDLVIKYGPGAKEAFKVGKEMQAALADPAAQSAVIQDLNSQPQKIAGLIQDTKASLGEKWAPLIEQYGNSTTDATGSFSKIYSAITKIAPEGDEIAQKSQQALLDRLKSVEDRLISQSPTGTLKDVPLKALADEQQALGSIVFEQGAYSKAPAVNGAAKKAFGLLKNAFMEGDKEASGGELSAINNAYSALYKMQEVNLNGAALKALTDPQNASAANKYVDFVTPLLELGPDARSTLVPKIENYLTNDFQQSLTRAQVMRLISNRGPNGADATHSLLSLAGLRGATKSSVANVANRLGAFSGSTPPSAIGGSLPSLGPVAPSLGSVLSPSQSSSPSLRQIK
jgi:hypothetical protein